MKLSPADLSELADLAIAAATEAGQMIARSRPSEVEHKAGADSLASQVVTEIDRHSENIILDFLTPTLERFELGLLTEERDDDLANLGGALSSNQNELTAPESRQHRVTDNAHAATSSKDPCHQLRGGGCESQRLQLAVYQGILRPLVAQNMW